MKLRALLDLPDLRLRLVTGEDGLDRDIRWVVTTDLRDPGRYLSGRELVLTGLVWWSEPADSEVFVRALAVSDVSGLAAWDVERGLIPPDLVDACRRHRIPLFEVPEDVAFATITEQVVRRLSTARAADLGAVLDRHRRLVAGLTSGTGLDPVLELLARDLDLRCWVLTPTGRLVAGPASLDAGPLARAFLTARRFPCSVGSWTLFPVAEETTSRVADWFIACEGDWTEWPAERLALTSELAAIAALERARLDDRLSIEGRLAQELIRLLASGTDEILPHLRLVGADLSVSFTAVSAVAGGGLRPGELRSVLTEILPGALLLGLLDEEAVALVQVDGVTETLRAKLSALAPGLTGLAVGVSNRVTAGELRGAVEEARYARRLAATRAEPVSVVGHDELGTHLILLASIPDAVRHMFTERLLDPLRLYDNVHKADLIKTLEVFLQHDGSWTRCAEQLHLHINSVRYRIQRIEELTNRNLSRLEDRVDFFLALRLR